MRLLLGDGASGCHVRKEAVELVGPEVTVTLALERVEAAYAFVRHDTNSAWSLREGSRGRLVDIGLFFHCYPHCAVNSLHLHIVDLSETGPTYEACSHKNLSMELVLKTLKQEIEKLEEMKLARQKNAKRS